MTDLLATLKEFEDALTCLVAVPTIDHPKYNHQRERLKKEVDVLRLTLITALEDAARMKAELERVESIVSEMESRFKEERLLSADYNQGFANALCKYSSELRRATEPET